MGRETREQRAEGEERNVWVLSREVRLVLILNWGRRRKDMGTAEGIQRYFKGWS
jgi:hypothetical protein